MKNKILVIGIIALIFIIILGQTANVFGFGQGGFFTSDLIGYIILAVLLIGVIVAVVSSGQSRPAGTHSKGLVPMFAPQN